MRSRVGYATTLWILLGLFVARVVAQLLVGIGHGGFLPPWEEWFSGAIPYPWLLVIQALIIVICARVCVDFTRRGSVVRPRPALGTLLLGAGSIYFGVMVIRYVIRMLLYPPERWTGGSIPIFFHWVLAGFILIVGSYHRRESSASAPAARSIGRRLMNLATLSLVAAGLLLWVVYQLAPTGLAWTLGAGRPRYAVRITRTVPMTMSDGVMLAGDVYHPLREPRTPTILVRIPFSKTLFNSLFATLVGRFWAEHGYTVVIQGTRGRYESGGRHTPLVDERRDGLDTLEWLKQQSWFDGRVGMWGGSAFGYTQWAIADQLPSPPAGRSALLIQIASTDFHGMFYPGGAFALSDALYWAARSHGAEDRTPDPAALQRGVDGFPLIEADNRAVGQVGFFDDWVTHSPRDAYWQAIDGENRAAGVPGPVMLMAGWFDPFLPTQLADYVRIRRDARPDVAAASRLVVGPWGHAETVTLPGQVRNRNYRLESLAPSISWFDRQLRSADAGAAPDAAPVRIYVMGPNVWRDEQEWPLARARDTSWYLRSSGHANSVGGDGQLAANAPDEDDPPDLFLADPLKPVPTRGGASLGYGAGPFPQNDIESRPDVLVYSTPPLAEDTEVTGPASVLLYVASSAPSADFTAKLVDVHVDGTAFNVSDGILRRSYHASPSPATAEPVPVEIELWPTSIVFGKGHRIRLEVAGSNFPRFDWNPNTGESIASATATAVATSVVHHGRRLTSRIVLPVVPPERH